jgi:hypothetical protein
MTETLFNGNPGRSAASQTIKNWLPRLLPHKKSLRNLPSCSFPDAVWNIYLYTFTPFLWPSFVGKYSSTMEHLGFMFANTIDICTMHNKA